MKLKDLNPRPKSKKNNYQKLITDLGPEKVKPDEPLVQHTSFKIGGPADLFLEVNKQEDFVAAVKAARQSSVPLFILGGGSNLLVSDSGFKGLVIENRTEGIKILGWKGKLKVSASTKASPTPRPPAVESVQIQAASGVTTNRLVRFCLDEGLAGLEHFLGLPGTVGGAIFGNAHFSNKWFHEKAASLKILDGKGEIIETNIATFRRPKANSVILDAVFNLEKAEKSDLWPKAENFLAKRKMTQPLDSSSAGCIFKNISKADALRLSTPNYTRSAGFLIEACGLKGEQVGQAKISEKHANFIINLGGATANNVLELINLIADKVLDKFDVFLEEEIIKVGKFIDG